MSSANRFFAAAAVAAALLFPALAGGDVAVPKLTARVTDLTGTLDSSQRTALESKLAAFEAKKGSQIAVLIVATTRPETIEQYSIRVVDQWKLGRKGIDDGALLVVAKDDHRLRIEVGRGLEGVIPDAVANRIVNEDITPRFKEGNFYAGITAGVDRMIRVIEGEPLPAPKATPTRGTSGWGIDTIEGLIGILFFIWVASAFLRRILGRIFGSAASGGIVGFVVWLAFSTIIGAGLAAIVAFVVSLFAGAQSGRHWRLDHGWGSGSGWSSGGWSSGGGGGGFSGGGGGFSGGGSSGSW